ncbi:MAG: hypothetical protein AAFX79_00970 [Planctomycetota bacterium]
MIRIAICILCVLVVPVLGEPQVVRTQGAGTLIEVVTPVPGGKWDIDIDFEATSTSFVVTVTADDDDDIRNVQITARGPAAGATTGTIVFDGDGGTGFIQSIEEIEFLGAGTMGADPARIVVNINIASETDTGRVGVAGGGGRLEAHRFSQIICNEITADIEVIEDNITSSGTINSIEIRNGGSLTGNVSARSIGILNVVDGDIGASGALVDIDVTAGDAAIQAESIYANIDVAGDITVFNVRGTNPSANVPDGVFDGTLVCDRFDQPSGSPFGLAMAIWGDLLGDITIRDEVNGDTSLAIGRTMDGDITLDEADGLEGQVIIGWLSAQTPAWNGGVTVDSVALSPKGAYTQTGLGGGAVTLAPHGLHFQDCDPAYTAGGGYPVITATTDREIDLVHYGQVQLVGGTGIPYRVDELPGAHNCSGSPCFEEGGHRRDFELDVGVRVRPHRDHPRRC